MPCFKGKEMPFPSSFSRGFVTPLLMEQCSHIVQGESSGLPLPSVGMSQGMLCLTQNSHLGETGKNIQIKRKKAQLHCAFSDVQAPDP